MVETGVADRVEFAVYGQQVIRGGELVPLGQNVLEFGDLRHVFLMPNLNPEKKLNYPGDSGRPRFIYGREQYDPVWFGEAQLLNDRNLRRAALDGPIELSRLYLGMGVSMAHVRAVKEGDYAVATSEYAASDRYHEETTHVRPLEPGEWRFVPEDSSLVEIYLKPNTFAFTMIGLDGLGRILCLACNGNPGQLGLLPYGRTLETAARRLLNLGAQDAILVDEGGDVFQKIERPGKAGGLLEALPLRRQQVRAMLIFARKKRGAGAASPPGEKGARR